MYAGKASGRACWARVSWRHAPPQYGIQGLAQAAHIRPPTRPERLHLQPLLTYHTARTFPAPTF